MYAVRCPACDKLLKLEGPVEGARLRCSSCGVTFVGTSEVVSEADVERGGEQQPPQEQAPPPPSRRMVPPAPLPAKRVRSVSPIPLIVVGVGVVGSIALVFVIRHVVSEQKARRHQPTVVRHVDDSQQHARTPTARRAGAPESADEDDTKPAQGVGGERGLRYAGGKIAEPQVRGDAKISVSTEVITGDIPDSGYVIGTVRNNHSSPLKEVRVTLHIFGAGNNNRRGSALCQYVPPGRTCPFSVPYEGLREQDIRKVEAIVETTLAGAGTVCWALEDHRIEPGDSRRIVRGRTRNRTKWLLMDVSIVCDFFTEEGIYAGSARGRLVEGNTLTPSQAEDYEVVFDEADSASPLMLVTKAFPRLVARRSD